MSALVRVQALSIHYRVPLGRKRVVNGLDLDIDEGEAFGLVGESGAGKSSIALALARCLPRAATMSAQRLEVAGTDLLTLKGEPLRRFRRDQIAFVFQEPSRALNPTARIGAQVAETQLIRGAGRRRALRSAVASLELVGLPNPDVLARRYPHELSGGQQQRVLIAMALATEPRLLVLDEPTASLDRASQVEVMRLISRLQAELGFASLLISHDHSIIAAHCRRVAVLEQGRLAKPIGPHPPVATRQTPLMRTAIPGGAPLGSAGVPSPEPRVIVSQLSKRYGSRLALDAIDLTISRGETLGVVGEPGSGKTTLARAVAGLISYSGHVVVNAPAGSPPVQMVFQSPEASLNPRRTVRQTLRRSIHLLGGSATPEELVDRTGLPGDALDRLPHELSGGQKQRVAIARAFAGASSVIVCDEPTSALDAGVRIRILELLIELQERTGVSYLFISHDISVVRRIAHRVAVMRAGRIIETAPAATFDAEAWHPYSGSISAASAAEPAS